MQGAVDFPAVGTFFMPTAPELQSPWYHSTPELNFRKNKKTTLRKESGLYYFTTAVTAW